MSFVSQSERNARGSGRTFHHRAGGRQARRAVCCTIIRASRSFLLKFGLPDWPWRREYVGCLCRIPFRR